MELIFCGTVHPTYTCEEEITHVLETADPRPPSLLHVSFRATSRYTLVAPALSSRFFHRRIGLPLSAAVVISCDRTDCLLFPESPSSRRCGLSRQLHHVHPPPVTCSPSYPLLHTHAIKFSPTSQAGSLASSSLQFALEQSGVKFQVQLFWQWSATGEHSRPRSPLRLQDVAPT